MIVLLVILALCFAWACIATGTAVSWERRYDGERLANGDWRERLATAEQRFDAEKADLQNRLSARTLGEYAGARVAMQAPEPEAPGYWRYDETGMIREFVPEGSESAE